MQAFPRMLFLKHKKAHTLHFNLNQSSGLSVGDNNVLNDLISALS